MFNSGPWAHHRAHHVSLCLKLAKAVITFQKDVAGSFFVFFYVIIIR